MTDARHLDDEVLSALLDGEAAGAEVDAGHLRDCAACIARAGELRAARDLVAGATVPPLAPSVLDRLVGAALDAPPAVAPVVPLAAARRRRVLAPPPAWLLGAAAGIAALAGVAGLLRSTGGMDDADGEAATVQLPSAEESAKDEGTGTIDPEVVQRDLGDIDDPEALAAAVLAGDTTMAFGAARATSGSAAEAQAQADASAEEGAGSGAEGAAEDQAVTAAPSVPPAAIASGSGGSAVDRARCRADAERIGAGRLGALLSTSTLRWAGQPAEVLVFALTEPAGGFSRQALVLARPGCGLLADPRF